ncbi:Bax inhibitor-1/YccA family protein [Streptomyces candidus]|uniref:Putative YccA/Bax inhibitor family protein n=1 Tax=Streptomyces candidus TaxID=67283 RepID=A0A7X0LNZ2_9ACTN|nr:Bax inhibitor-1/YccA family protein [Streptomyces candidus]MBB6435387.1 putative YccA/Bax inhibitor family protein [Streptomyces candidus]GHH47684.1 membrane protein [Streptomyces candidus]
MRSSNPVFSRRGFSRDNGYAGFNAQQPQAGGPAVGTQGNPYAQDAQNPYATNPYAQQDQYGAPVAPPRGSVMTMDDVVTRTAITLGVVVAGATVAWVTDMGLGLAIGAALVAMVLGLIQAFKSKPMPPVILAYAGFEGLFLGAISNYVNQWVPGAPMQAVLGTMAVFATMLVLYKTRIVRVTARFTRFVMIAAISFMVLTAVNLLFMVFGGGDGLGFRSGGMGILFGVVGVLLGSFFLAMDFKQVEDGVAYGAPREESWLAAFGLTMTLVWIYLEMLRLVAILSGDD